MRSLALVEMSATEVHAGMMVLAAYSRAAKGCWFQYADASCSI